MTEIQALFIENLRKARAEAGFTQAVVAERCGLSTFYITELETGRRFPSVATLQLLCDVLSKRPYQFFMAEKDWLDLAGLPKDKFYKERLKGEVMQVFDRFE